MQGYEVVLTSGTDEHGQKIEKAATEQGKSPKEFTDLISVEFEQMWNKLGIAPDRFRRTTDPRHHKMVQRALRAMPRKRVPLQRRLHRPLLRAG